MVVAKRQTKGKAHTKGTKEKYTDQSKNLRRNKHTPFMASPGLHSTGSEGEETKHLKRGS